MERALSGRSSCFPVMVTGNRGFFHKEASMRANAESNRKERRSVREYGIPPNMPEILAGTAQELRDNGCGETLIRAALLSLCGIEIRGLSLSALHIW